MIGSCVVESLLSSGQRVIGVDDMNDSYDVRLKEWRLGNLTLNGEFVFHRADISDSAGMEEVFTWPRSIKGSGSSSSPGTDIQAVINLAARAGVRQSVEDPRSYYRSNVDGTLNLLELCAKYGVKKFVLASTSSVYGGSDIGRTGFSEDMETDRPLSPYAASKKAAENLCHTFHHIYGLDVSVLRYFTVFGPAGRPDMSLFRFVKWLFEDVPLLVFGDGKQSRDFTFVADVAEATIKALKPLGFEILNVGSDRPIVLNDAISMLEKMVGRQARIEFMERNSADVSATWANIEKTRSHLDWHPNTTFEDGLRVIVEWYAKNRQWASEIATE